MWVMWNTKSDHRLVRKVKLCLIDKKKDKKESKNKKIETRGGDWKLKTADVSKYSA